MFYAICHYIESNATFLMKNKPANLGSIFKDLLLLNCASASENFAVVDHDPQLASHE